MLSTGDKIMIVLFIIACSIYFYKMFIFVKISILDSEYFVNKTLSEMVNNSEKLNETFGGF